MHCFLFGKSDFVLGGVDIDIHPVERNGEEQYCHREAALHQPAGVARHQGMSDHPVPDKPSVDINVDPPGRAAVDPGGGQPTGGGEVAVFKFQAVQSALYIPSEDIGDPIRRIRCGGPVFHHFFIVKQSEMDLRPPHGDAGKGIRHMAHFSTDRF